MLNSPFKLMLLARGSAFVAAIFCLWQICGSVSMIPQAKATIVAPARHSLKTQPIASLRVGQRVLADNPELSGPALPDSDIVPGEWRTIRLVMDKPNGGKIDLELLRPLDWLLSQGLQAAEEHPEYLLPRPVVAAITERPLCELLLGRTIHVDLPEMGASGPALVTAITPCPEIESTRRSGRRIITGTFHHSAGNVLDLQIEGEPQSIGVTDNHPFWSEDRHAFVPAGELHKGERLRKADDTLARVTRITPRAGPPVPVYNLEVDAEHVYLVGTTGILVHNTYITYSAIDAKTLLPYYGRASGAGTIEQILSRRLSSHHRTLLNPRIDSYSESYEAIRGREQELINLAGGLEFVANAINGVSGRNPQKLQTYLDAAVNVIKVP